ncbi:MAG: LLM class flavin-dependent oxidoreductase [Chloroflexi bacterium]|nr:LLM class flavin-dependent oxidoreductase [Chloroflexota bacterium]MBV9896648.1 LLM class flavin-dependent oxidoreductase [Chloroflexota bacterium]
MHRWRRGLAAFDCCQASSSCHARAPPTRASRAELVDEGLETLRRLLSDRRATYQGRHYGFEDVELYPKSSQAELALLIGGNTDRAIRRAAHFGDGCFPAGLGPEQLCRRPAADALRDGGGA